jgi:hypothetical protein
MTTIYCTAQVRELWPRPLAHRWLEEYPNIFDADDLRLTKFQPKNHFCEWFAAIHLFQSRAALSLVEQYRRLGAHPWKKKRFERLLSPEERRTLNDICAAYGVQPPDLLVYTPDFKERWFVEVKGPGDRLSEKQLRSHRALATDLKIAVELIEVRISGRRPPHLRIQPTAIDRDASLEPARRRG